MSALYHKIKNIIVKISSYQVPLYAANTSFYLILSFFPAVMLILCLLPYIGFSEEDLVYAIQSITPSAMDSLLANIIKQMSENSTGFLISATAIVAIWSSSRSMYCIQQGLNAICGVTENRNYFIRRILSVLHMIILIAALLLTFVLHGFGSEIADYFESKSVPILRFIVKLLRFRGLLLFILLSILFTALYCILPNRKVQIRSALPGSVLSALGWQLFTFFFSYYVKHSGSYSLIYGSLSGIAIGMLWLFFCFSILFYGSVFNVWLEKRKEK